MIVDIGSNMILPLVFQDASGATNWLWWLLPIVCCFLTLSQREEKPQESTQVSDTVYTSLNIEDAFETVEKKIELWRIESREKDTREKGISSSIRKLIGGGATTSRFSDYDKQPPRLYSLNDVSGTIYFEFTGVDGGGTVLRITYNPVLRARMSRLKSELPLIIPATPIGLKCPSCGKPVLNEFNLCPYCGTELIKE